MTVHDDPMERFDAAFERAREFESFEPTLAALASVGAQGQPSVRFVLVNVVDGRGFCFFTNYGSRKAGELLTNPRASLAYHWTSIGEQIRIEGQVEKVSEEESDAYFAQRPRGSRIGAWASDQSRPLESYATLQRKFHSLKEGFGSGDVPRPEYWGGYRLVPSKVEFWLDRPDRLHERYLYVRGEQGWHRQQLQP